MKQLSQNLARLALGTLFLALAESKAVGMENGLEIKIAGARVVGAVRVGDIDAGESHCSGILITPHWILTGAHCPAKCGMNAIVGSRYETLNDRARIEGRVVHPNYVPPDRQAGTTAKWDVSLVRLFTPLYRHARDGSKLRNFRTPIVGAPAHYFVDGRSVVFGYGITREAEYDENGRLSDRDFRDIGTLRLGEFEIGDVEGRRVRLDDRDARLFNGDSGAAILIPGHAERIVLDHYQVLGVISFIRGSDAFGLSSQNFKNWADQVIDGDHAPSLCPAPVANVVSGNW